MALKLDSEIRQEQIAQAATILWHMSDGEFDVTHHAERAWRVFVAAIRED